MEPLIIEATEDTPKVHLDAEKGEFLIADRSLPENSIEFYQPVFEWLNNYVASPNEETIFDFKLEYFNTSSAKQLTKVLLILEKLAANTKVKIMWYYKKEDFDMLSSGQRYAKLIEIDFEFIEFE
ncbi:MAG: nuclear pore complex subunit [Marinilabiliales bacterium]|mgnify:CR=1 FL=1|nr:MAG: nuclear pore complex subunit [Marinilabiliales bacterium]